MENKKENRAKLVVPSNQKTALLKRHFTNQEDLTLSVLTK
jgi:hypothetical protein